MYTVIVKQLLEIQMFRFFELVGELFQIDVEEMWGQHATLQNYTSEKNN